MGVDFAGCLVLASKQHKGALQPTPVEQAGPRTCSCPGCRGRMRHGMQVLVTACGRRTPLQLGVSVAGWHVS